MWSEKYRPNDISEMVGNEEARSAIMEWFGKWKKGTKPILLVGPPGIGKTTIAFLVSKKFGYDLIHLNASDVRNKSQINDILSPLLGNVTVLGKPMIFVDEVDGIHGRSDFGGVEALIKILKEPTVPIVLAANSDNSDKMKKIKKVTKTIRFRPIPPRLLRVYLSRILKKEDAHLGPGSLIRVIDQSHGDIRSLINLTQALVSGFDPQMDKSFESINIEDGINSFFKAKSIEEARVVLYSIRIDPRDKINAFYSSIVMSNLPKEDMARMLKTISRADILYGRIIKTQNWRLLRYLNEILIKLYQKDSPIRYVQYNLSWPLLNKIRWDGRKIKALGSLFAKRFHVSGSTFATIYFPFLLKCLKKQSIEIDVDSEFNEILDKEMNNIK